MCCFGEYPIEGTVMTILHALEIAPHLVGAPGIVARQLRDFVPIFVMGVYNDQRAVRRTPAQGSGAGIKDAVLLGDELAILLLLREVGVVPDEKFPTHCFVFRGESVENGNVVVFGQAISAGVVGVAALKGSRVSARFQQNHAVTRFGKARRESSASGARANHHEFAVRLPPITWTHTSLPFRIRKF